MSNPTTHGRAGTVIPFPGPTDPQTPNTDPNLVPPVPDGGLLGEPEITRRPMPVVLPLWLQSRDTVRATLRWAVRYAGHQVAFHAWRAPAYGLALAWWTLRGAARAITAGFGWVSVRGEYRPLITAAREAKRWDLVRDLITERRALARVRMKATAWLAVSGGSAGTAGFLTLGPVFGWCAVTGAGLGALWLGRPLTAPMLPPGPVLPVPLELSAVPGQAVSGRSGPARGRAQPEPARLVGGVDRFVRARAGLGAGKVASFVDASFGGCLIGYAPVWAC
ncbi:MAG: hypothetical protein ACRDRA_19315 [Pseudonocardiaceae bacterium]